MAHTPQISKRLLSQKLKELAEQAVSVEDNGDPISRAEALAKLIWDKALGCVTMERDDEGNLKERRNKPEAWAIQFLAERMEGKAPQAVADEASGIRAADRVRDLAKDRINRISTVVTGPPKHKKKVEAVP
jgi:hypothetical protein